MKKITSLLLTAVLLSLSCITAGAAESAGTDPQTVAEQPAQAQIYYQPVEAAAAAAMINSDSFVDKAADQNNFDLPCKAALLMDESTGQILYAKNPDQQLPIASITKVMTMLLVFEAIDSGKIKLNDTVPITPHAFSMGGSQIWLEPGEIFTVDELLKAVAVSSANDAAVALAEFVGGSEEGFCMMMNERAAQLGMEHTNFVNACGLDEEGHLSCAKDVAIMSRALMQHPKVFEYTTIWMDYLRNGSTQLVNTNKLLKNYTGTTGLKTGTTNGAGVCITATAKRNDLSLIAVVLGSASSEERFEAAKKLLDFGFSNFESRPFPSIDDYPKSIKVKYGVQKNVPLQYDLPKNLLFLKGNAANLESKITLPEYIEAPLEKGAQIGSVDLYSKQGKIKEYSITLAQSAEKVTFKKAFEILLKSMSGSAA